MYRCDCLTCFLPHPAPDFHLHYNVKSSCRDVGALRHVLLHLFVFVFVMQLVVHCAVNCCSTTVSPLIRKPRIHVLWFRLSKRLPVHLGEGVSLVGRCRHRRNPPSENGDLESAENGDLRTERRRDGEAGPPTGRASSSADSNPSLQSYRVALW